MTADVAASGAAGAMAMRGAARRTALAVPADSAGRRNLAAVPVAGSLQLPAHLDGAGVQVHVLPAEPDRLGLPDAHRQRDRPARAIAAARGRRQDPASLVPGQRLDFDVLAGRPVPQPPGVNPCLSPLPPDL